MGRGENLAARGTSTGDPRFLEPQYERRCPDCDLNGYLHADGRVRGWSRHLIRRCSVCGGSGRLHLLTRDRLQRNPALARHVNEPGWVFVSRKETLDPYMLDLAATSTPQKAVGATLTPRNRSRDV